MRSRRTNPDGLDPRCLARANRDALLGGTILLLFCAAVLLGPALPSLLDQDGAPLRRSTAEVKRVTYPFGPGYWSQRLSLDLNQNPVELTTRLPPNSPVLQIGGRVRVSYLVGKSGRWYIKDVEPD